MERHEVKCDRWNSGVCQEIADTLGEVVFCPRARAENARAGECCHHPLYWIRPRLIEMKKAGVKLRRYGKKLHDPAFVERLYSAFLKSRSRCSTASSKTSGKS